LSAIGIVGERQTGIRPRDLATWLACVGFALLLGVLSWFAQGWTTAVMVAAVLVLRWWLVRAVGLQAGLVVLLVVTSVVDRYTFRVGSLDLRAEQVATILALASVLVTRLGASDWSWIKPNVAEGILLAWFAANVVSSLLWSPERNLSAKIIALIAVCALAFALPRRLLSGSSAPAQFETITRWLLIVFATECAWGALAYLVHVFGPTISLGVNPASGHLSTYGTLWEQNVFGAFAAAGAVAWVYLGPGRFRFAWVGLALCLAGLLYSLTRAAWLAAAVVGGIGGGWPGLRRRTDLRTVALGALATLPFVATAVVAEKVGMYVIGPGGGQTRFSLLTALLNLVDVVGRLNQWAPVSTDIRGHLILGRGTASFEALHVVNGVPQHVASLPLLILNDTGLIGLALFGAFAAAVFARTWARRRVPIVVGYGQVALVIGLTNLATETTELMIGWLMIGLLMAAADHLQTESPATE
jgi:hypothetical protein